MMTTGSRTDRLAFAAVSGLTVVTWYALPDAVRSRPLRAAIKVGLLGVTAAGVGQIPRVYPDATKLIPKVDVSDPKSLALTVAGTAAAVAATVGFEKVVFAFGERVRAGGVRCAHTPAAAAMALATAAAALVDWSQFVVAHERGV
jgi:hypothetical protein